MRILPTLFIVCAALFAQNSMALGQTPEVAVVFVLARSLKCADDQPELAKQLEQVVGAWVQRNRKYVQKVSAISDFNEAVHATKVELNKQGVYDLATCVDQVKMLRSESSDLDHVFR